MSDKAVNHNKNNKSDELFSDINLLIGDELKKVDEIIINNSRNASSLIADIVKHLILSGGKRIRPILTILSAKLCGYNSNIKTNIRHANLAAAIELIHTATLLHDDVIDESGLRRGKKTSNAIWGNKASILVGDYLLSIAFELMILDGSLPILKLLSNASSIMADGEIKQLNNRNNIEISEREYLEIIFSKTAILFSAALQIGAIITDSSKEKSLKNFGTNLGMSFQITDDILDYSSKEQILGKEIGNDFFEGKITLPIIITYKNANQNEKRRLQEIFSANLANNKKEYNQKLLQEILALINKYKALEEAQLKAKHYQILAQKTLNSFSKSKEKEMLLAILNYLITRQY